MSGSLLVAAAVWASDVIAVASSASPPPGGSLVVAAVAGVFLALLSGLIGGGALGLVYAVSLGERRGDEALPAARARLRRWLLDGPTSAHHRRIGALLGGFGLLLGLSGASFLLTRELVVEMARPHFIALGVLGGHIALVAIGAALFPFARATGASAVRLVGRIPFARHAVARTAFPVAAACVLALTATVVAVVRFRTVVAVLPWETALRLLAALAVGLLAMAVLRRALRSPRAKRAVYAVLAAVFVGTGIFATMLSPAHQIAHDILVSRLLSTHLALAAVTPPLDFDGDGSISVFGGGDCRPFDSSVHPSAIDIPENGIDEDCADGDLDSDDVDLWARWDYPVNKRIPERLPIILVTNDTFAVRRMSALGYNRPTTPNIDRFAESGAFFVNTFTQGPSTRLSFPSIFTSRWDSQIARELVGKHPYPVLPENETIAEILRDAGYRTAAVIPATYFLPSRWRGLLQGFDHVKDGPARAYNERKNDHTAAAVTKAALQVLREKHDKPLFLWVHYFDSHSPHVAPKGSRPFGKDEQAVYDAELRHVDAEIGKLLRGIEKETRGKALVILTGDHGIGFDKPRHAKRHYGQDINTISLHVPMIVTAPFVKPRRIDAIATTLDIAPTIVNLLGLKGDFEFQGVSLVPSLLDGRDERPQFTFHQFYIHESLWKGNDPLRHIGVRTERYNFLLDRTKGESELYDWTTDYEERKNLVDSHPEVASELRSTLMLYLWHVTGRRGDEKQGVRPLRLAVGKLPAVANTPAEPEAAAPGAMAPEPPEPESLAEPTPKKPARAPRRAAPKGPSPLDAPRPLPTP